MVLASLSTSMNKKAAIWALVIIIVVGGVYALTNRSTEPVGEEVIKIGAVIPISGIAATYGENQRNAIELAVDEINDSGGVAGRPLEVVFEDDETNTAKTVSAFQKLISVDGVEVVIGAVWDFLANAVIPVADVAGVLIVSPSAAPDTLDTESRYFISVFPPIFSHEGIFSEYLESLTNTQNVVIMTINNAWGDAHRQMYLRALEGTKHTVVKDVVLPKFDGNDIQREMSLIKALDPTLILLGTNLVDPKIVIERNLNLGINAVIAGHDNTATNFFNGNLSEEEIEGVIVYKRAPANEDFVRNYEERYGSTPISEADVAYDAVYIIKEALENSSGVYEADTLIEGLRRVRYEGASGTFDFSEANYPTRSSSLYIFRSGELIPLEL